ncbi:MAG: DUF1292 domain-containing protein [bacterium]
MMAGKKAEPKEEYKDLITLTDQNGESMTFECLDIIEYRDQEYAVLLNEDEEIMIFVYEQVVGAEDEAVYSPVEDPAVDEKVYRLFQKKYRDIYDFSD